MRLHSLQLARVSTKRNRATYPVRDSLRHFGTRGVRPVQIEKHVMTANTSQLVDERDLIQLLASAPDLSEWEQRPRTQIVSEKAAAACPYLAGSARQPRNIRTLRRWRKSLPARGPSFLKIGGRYFYTVGALRDFYRHCVRSEE